MSARGRMILLVAMLSGGALAAPGCSGGGAPAGGLGGAAAATGGRGGGGAGTVGATGGRSGSGGSGNSGGAGGGYSNVGVCGARIQATADAASFAGYEERYLIGEQGFGTDICVVHFDLTRVGDAPAGCSDCLWTHLLEYGKAAVTTDTGGVCAASDLALDAAALAKISGSRIAIGFAKQLNGAHGSARMTYNSATSKWDVTGNATWNETSKMFKSDYRDGVCNYGP